MGGASRFMTLLTAPFPSIRPSRILLHRRLSSLSITPIRLHALTYPFKTKIRTSQAVRSFHSQPDNNTYALHSAAQQQPQHQNYHPWPEWIQFLNFLSSGQGFSLAEDHKNSKEDAFVVYEQLTDEFVSAASACVAFARARPDLLGLLPRRDIEAVVSNGTPFLFKSALNTSRRMRAFLGTNVSNVPQVDQANTVDLMKYIISYASNPTVPSERNGLYSRELVDSSVRNLLCELSSLCGGAPTSKDGHFPKPIGQNIEMKRGDWICPKCNFMNFARNIKCLECEEPRPKRQLTGGEWNCPQCSFFNYGRNRVCLRCECRRPSAPLFNNTENIGTQTVEASNFSNQTTISSNPQDSPENSLSSKDSSDRIDIQNEAQEQTQKSERWFKKIAELHNVKDLPSAVSDEDFPEIMPMRKGENRFVVSKKKDRSLTSPQYKRQVAMDQANSTNFVPFVPFPPGYFARKDSDQSSQPTADTTHKPTTDPNTMGTVNTNLPSETRVDPSDVSRIHNQPMNSTPSQGSAPSNTVDGDATSVGYSAMGKASELARSENVRSEWVGPSLEGSAVKETDPLDMSEEAKAERWFKRVAQIKDISELSQIPDEDFPSIMPMRKGVNRFVVSKRKTPLERRLTSQQYRRNLPVVTNDPVKKESDSS